MDHCFYRKRQPILDYVFRPQLLSSASSTQEYSNVAHCIGADPTGGKEMSLLEF